MTIDSLLKSAKSVYKGERANLVCEILLAHFLGQNRVFLHANGDKKIQYILDSIKNNPCDSTPNLARFVVQKIGFKDAVVPSADFLLESEKRGSPPKSEKRQLLARRGSGAGGAALLREKTSESNMQSGDFMPPFTSPQALKSALLKSISRLNDSYPLEYITKKASFYGMDFFIDEGALIPRPETELLVDKATQIITRHNIQQIYEIGTGSGIIAITLCLLNPRIQITATDISPTALQIAQKNIALKSALDATLKSRIRLIHADLLQGTDFTPKDSLIISNPPYIAEDYALPKNVAFEPQIALFGGKNGDEILRKIIALNADFLCCEIGHNQGYLAEFLEAYKSVEFYKDYAGFTRGFVAF